jgi:putative glycosyltransferase (TIGR04372 family)
VISFIKSQFVQVKKGRLSILLRKAKSAFKVIITVIIFIPLAVFVRLISPIKQFSFRALNNTRIGHFAINTEIYLCEKDAGFEPKNSLDIFFIESNYICNQQLFKMWKRKLIVSQIAYYFHFANRLLRMQDRNSSKDIYNLLESTCPHLEFTTEEHELGRDELNSMSININDKFICFLARDDAYLVQTFKNMDWYYHNYRDCSVENYLLAAEELTKRGYYALRMGSIVKESLNTQNPKIIDYASKFRTDFMDIYLGANCHFIISCGSGFDSIPRIFRKPIVYVNRVPIDHLTTYSYKFINIFKRHWNIKEKRFMSLFEIFTSGASKFLRTQQYEQIGVELIENTSEEIRDAAIEMDERLKGTWQTTEEDEELQRRFWKIFGKYADPELHGEFRARIGANFLRQNRYLLE